VGLEVVEGDGAPGLVEGDEMIAHVGGVEPAQFHAEHVDEGDRDAGGAGLDPKADEAEEDDGEYEATQQDDRDQRPEDGVHGYSPASEV